MKMISKVRHDYEGVRLLLLDPLTKVFYDEDPAEAPEEEEILSFHDECVSFQVAYTFEGYRVSQRWAQSIRWTSVILESELKPWIRVRRVCNVPCQYPAHDHADDNYLRTAPGLYPDRLEELEDSMAVFQAHQWKSLWFDLEIPEEVPAGVYPLKIIFFDIEDQKEFCSLETQIRILEPSLPEKRLLRTEWFHADCLADYYHVPVFSEEHWAIMEHFIRAAAKRGINMILTPQFTPPLDTAVGRERTAVQLVDVKVRGGIYEFGFDKLERWVHMCSDCGIRYFEMSHLFSQWGAVAAPAIFGETEEGKQELFGWNTPATGKEYIGFLHQYLPQLRGVLKKLGIEDRVYFHISDEPKLEQITSYRAAFEAVRDVMEGCNFIEALSDYEFYQSGLVRRPICAVSAVQPFLEKNTKGLWTYYCTAQAVDVSNRFIAMPLSRTRIYGVQMYKFGIEGSLHWGYNFYNGVDSMCRIDPYQVTDACGAYPAGDPFIVYPGSDGYPEESIRMMVLDEAMNDVRALEYLETLTGREKVLAMIDEDLDEPLTFDRYPSWPQDKQYLLKLRRKVNDAICRALEGRGGNE